MESRLDCYPCFLRIALQASRLSGADEATQQRIMVEALELLKTRIVGKSPLQTAHQIQQIVIKHTGCEDPYQQVKLECNEEAAKWLTALRSQVECAADPLQMAMKVAAIGNIMDYGAFASFDIGGVVAKLSQKEFTVDASGALREKLEQARSLTYFLDNTGEVIFDSVFVEQLCKLPHLQQIKLIIRNAPFLNDVSALAYLPEQLRHHPNIEIHSLSVVRDDHDRADWESLTSSDVVLCKGMANFENYSEEAGFFFLLISKCDLVSRLIAERMHCQVNTGDWILMQGV